MRRSSIPIRAAQALATLLAPVLAPVLALVLALLLVCAPLCRPRACTHACCPSHSGDCQNGIDLSASLSCSRAVPAAAISSARLLPALLHALASTAGVVPSERRASSQMLLRSPATTAPTPPLRI
ncbi:MAG TPA: hypothetical protein VMD92_06960 [Acidobacteriaceae bacterium]|nr:hypothetical protein [Acidobacteriaceae bacterium]